MKKEVNHLLKVGMILFVNLMFQSLAFGQIEVVSKTGSACNTCTGKIKIKPIDGAATPLRIRIMDSGNTVHWHDNLVGEYEFTGVCPGKLRISVEPILQSGCDPILINEDPDFSIPGTGIGGFEIVVTSIKNAIFPYDPNDHGPQEGAISVTTNIYGNYIYNWSNGMTGSAISGLPSGTYTVTATQESGCMATKAIIVGHCKDYWEYPDADGYLTREPIDIAEDFEVNISGGTNLSGQSQITLTARVKRSVDQSYGNVPDGYIVQWTDNFGNILGYGASLTASSANLESQSPITAKVSNGCIERSKSEHILVDCNNQPTGVLVNKFILSLQSSCSINNADSRTGRITFNILKSSLTGANPYKVWVDNILVSSTAPSISGFVEVGNLLTGNHLVKIEINSCTYNFTVNLGINVATYSWVGFTNERCSYNAICGDRLQRVNVQPVRSHAESFEGRECTFTNICNFDGISRKVGTGKDDFKETRAGVYLQILKNARRNPPNGVSVAFLDDMIKKTEGLKACNRVKFCPITFKKISHDSPLEFLLPKPTFACIANTLFLTCGPDRLLQVGNVPDEDCCYDHNKKTKESFVYSLKLLVDRYRAVTNKQDIYDESPGFEGSELETTLIQYQNSTDRRVNCANIEVCFLDFSVKSLDIAEVDCNVFVEVSNINGVFKGPSCTLTIDGIYACKKIGRPLGYFLNTKLFPRETKKIFFRPADTEIAFTHNDSLAISSDSSEIKFKYFTDSTDVEKFKGFYPITAEDFVCPKAIVEVNNQNNILYDYSHAIDEVEKSSFPNVQYKVDNWDINQSASIHRLSDEDYALNYVRDSIAWYSPISADSLLSIDFLGMKDSFSLVGGHFWGVLKYNDSIISRRSDVSTLFLIKTAPIGTVTGAHFIEAIDTTYQPLFVKDKHGQTIISVRAKGKWVRLDGENFELISPGVEILLKVDSAFNMTILKQISLNAQSQVLDLATSSNGDYFAYSISKAGTVADEQSVMTVSLGNKFALLSFSSDGTPVWQRIWSGDSINLDKTALAFGKNGDLFAGLTFAGSIVSLSDSLSSHGGYDIALLKFQQNGTTTSSYTYGTADDENVSQLLYDQQVLFFGGEISGNTKIREIGKYHFVNFTAFNDRAYVSYIPDTLPAPPTSELLQLDDTKVLTKTPAKATKNVLKVFPNPFMDNLKTEFKLESSGQMKILMLNELGKVVQSQIFEGYKGANSINMSTQGLPSGVYIIQVLDKSGQLYGVEKVIKI